MANAQYSLGCMYYNGKGVDQSNSKAKEWFTKAAAQGYEKGINALKALLKLLFNIFFCNFSIIIQDSTDFLFCLSLLIIQHAKRMLDTRLGASFTLAMPFLVGVEYLYSSCVTSIR